MFIIQLLRGGRITMTDFFLLSENRSFNRLMQMNRLKILQCPKSQGFQDLRGCPNSHWDTLWIFLLFFWKHKPYGLELSTDNWTPLFETGSNAVFRRSGFFCPKWEVRERNTVKKPATASMKRLGFIWPAKAFRSRTAKQSAPHRVERNIPLQDHGRQQSTVWTIGTEDGCNKGCVSADDGVCAH